MPTTPSRDLPKCPQSHYSRKVRRDRRMVEFGERSPLFLWLRKWVNIVFWSLQKLVPWISKGVVLYYNGAYEVLHTFESWCTKLKFGIEFQSKISHKFNPIITGFSHFHRLRTGTTQLELKKIGSHIDPTFFSVLMLDTVANVKMYFFHRCCWFMFSLFYQ